MHIIAIIGRSASGKDTIQKLITTQFEHIKPVISYTTRPKREGEIDGREHYFVDQETFDKIKSDEANILAYTKFPKTGYEYMASSQNMNKDGVYTYIINPEGIMWLKKNRPDIKITAILLKTSEFIRTKRAKFRGDSYEAFLARNESEDAQFKEFEKKAKNVHRVNADFDLHTVWNSVTNILVQTLPPESLEPRR